MADDHTERIIGAAIEVHRILGPGLLESIYEEALCHDFDLCHIAYQRQVTVDVRYKDKIIHGQRIDLIAFEQVVIEIKSLRVIPDTGYRYRTGVVIFESNRTETGVVDKLRGVPPCQWN